MANPRELDSRQVIYNGVLQYLNQNYRQHTLNPDFTDPLLKEFMERVDEWYGDRRQFFFVNDAPITIDYTVLLHDSYLQFDSSSNNINVFLPNGSTIQPGQAFNIIDATGAVTFGTNKIIVVAEPEDKIIGKQSFEFTQAFESHWFLYLGNHRWSVQ